MFTSTVYGLTIRSDIALPELAAHTTTDTPDLRIVKSAVPLPALCGPDQPGFVSGQPGQLDLEIKGTITMRITNGSDIVYTPGEQADARDLRLFLMGSGMGTVLMQRGFLVMHGNSVVPRHQDKALICVGVSGAGKSTLAVALAQQGHRVLADDVSPIGADGKILPGMPSAKLRDDAAEKLAIQTDAARLVSADYKKYKIPLEHLQCETPHLPGAVYELVPDDIDRVEISKVTGADAFALLRRNVYRPEYLDMLGLELSYFKRLTDLVQHVPVFTVRRPAHGFDIERLSDAILDNFCNP